MPNPIAIRFYPQLSEIIAETDLPDVLSFVQDGLDDILKSIHYKNLQFSRLCWCYHQQIKRRQQEGNYLYMWGYRYMLVITPTWAETIYLRFYFVFLFVLLGNRFRATIYNKPINWIGVSIIKAVMEVCDICHLNTELQTITAYDAAVNIKVSTINVMPKFTFNFLFI